MRDLNDKKKININIINILFLMSLTFLVKPEIYTIFFIFISLILVLKNKTFFFKSTKYINYLFLLFFTGSFFILSNEIQYVKNDIGYLIKAITCFLIGFILGTKIFNFTKFLEYIIVLLFIYSLYWIYLVSTNAVNFDNYAEFNMMSFKSVPYIATLILPLVLLKIDNKYFLDFKILNRYLFFIIILIGIFFSFSRTKIFLILLSFFILFFYKKKIKISYIIFFISMILIINLNSPFFENFSPIISKFRNSFNEILFFNGTDLQEIYLNWRGFELLKAYEQFQNVGLFKKFFGQSFGATVNLQNNFSIGNIDYYSELPYIHNGYFQILTKFGIIGIIFVIIFYIKVTFTSNRKFKTYFNKKDDQILLILKLILMIYFIFLTLVISGLFNHSALDHIIIFSGLINGYLDNKYN